MNEFFNSNPNLMNYLTQKMASLKHSELVLEAVPSGSSKFNSNNNQLTEKEKQFKENRAAKIIQHTFRLNQLKKKKTEDVYSFYLSLMDEKDEQRLLAHVIFGTHVAEIDQSSPYRVKNPYIYSEALYHRDDDLSDTFLVKSLVSQFGFRPKVLQSYDFVPVTLLTSTPVEEIIKRHFPKSAHPPKIVKHPNLSIAFVALSRLNGLEMEEMKETLSICGLVASPWELAINIKKPINSMIKTRVIDPHLNLPQTKEALLKSKLFNKFNVIAHSSKKSTKKLAMCVQQLLFNLPDLSPTAIQRIALILDITTTFYANNYPQFAFCVYTLIHEISLSLLEQQDLNLLKKDFIRLSDESNKNFLGAFKLREEDLPDYRFVTALTLSGTNAYLLAMQLAEQMITATGKRPKIKVYPPMYYEFNAITKESSSDKPDILVISAGPIVDESKTVPGIDINQLVKRELINKHRADPLTIIIDTTSALYKNLQLDPEVKALTETGQLSLIINESYQKFNLLHTDQAQCGRVWALCSKKSYRYEVLNRIQYDAWMDFQHHVDLRIGAFINTYCRELLEEIKKQHFTNGALLRSLLIQTKLLDDEMVLQQDALTNPDELFFVSFNSKQAVKLGLGTEHIETRDSFGHFTITGNVIGAITTDGVAMNDKVVTRISPDASDDIDSLIQATQIYLASYYKKNELIKIMIENAKKCNSLSYEEQIVSLALINNISSEPVKKEQQLELYCGVNQLIDNCSLLKGRYTYQMAINFLLKLQNDMFTSYIPKSRHDFLHTIQSFYQQGLDLELIRKESTMRTGTKRKQSSFFHESVPETGPKDGELSQSFGIV